MPPSDQEPRYQLIDPDTGAVVGSLFQNADGNVEIQDETGTGSVFGPDGIVTTAIDSKSVSTEQASIDKLDINLDSEADIERSDLPTGQTVSLYNAKDDNGFGLFSLVHTETGVSDSLTRILNPRDNVTGGSAYWGIPVHVSGRDATDTGHRFADLIQYPRVGSPIVYQTFEESGTPDRSYNNNSGRLELAMSETADMNVTTVAVFGAVDN